MKILVADKFPPFGITALSDAGHQVKVDSELNGSQLPTAIEGSDVLVVRSTPVTRATIEAAQNLCLIIRAGAGTNTIDKEAATKHGIRVCNVPGRNAAAVAELVMGLLIAIDRRIPDNVSDLRDGRWDKKEYSIAHGLYGRSLGIIGVGAIGLAVLERAAAFGLKLHVIEKDDRSTEIRQQLRDMNVVSVPSVDVLIDKCDVLSFHVPSDSETRGMVNAEFLHKLHSGTILINTARGDLIDESALVRALESKDLRVGLDVYCDEPGSSHGEFRSVLAKHKQVYGTHHIGASTLQAQTAVAEGVVEVILRFTEGKIINCVNVMDS